MCGIALNLLELFIEFLNFWIFKEKFFMRKFMGKNIKKFEGKMFKILRVKLFKFTKGWEIN